MERGRFISLEGGEGVGKSTQLTALRDALQARGLDVHVTREPGGSPGAEEIRELLLGGEEARWSARAEALLFAAARADHVEKVIRPALNEGRWVLSDRFIDSSIAYQGEAGGLGVDAIRALHRFGSEDFFPDRTLVLMLEGGEGGRRARARDQRGDRIGDRDGRYHDKVERGFRAIAEAQPDRVRLIDASGAPDDVTKRLIDELADVLP
ncbi:dTMP kinase [Sphingomicrobium sp. XHP0239]|uniref:dTMP kinase n=1 Tax=Sphingomicrobium maritimum TaxID=3133972 RepID=UPI0031CCA707